MACLLLPHCLAGHLLKHNALWAFFSVNFEPGEGVGSRLRAAAASPHRRVAQLQVAEYSAIVNWHCCCRRETERETDRKTDRQMDRQAGGQTDRQADEQVGLTSRTDCLANTSSSSSASATGTASALTCDPQLLTSSQASCLFVYLALSLSLSLSPYSCTSTPHSKREIF